MSMISRMAAAGLVALSTAVTFSGVPTVASAEEVRDTCQGQVTVAEEYRAERGNAGNLVLNPGDRADGEVGLNGLGWIRWYCDEGAGVTEHRADCMDGGNDALVEVRLREDGGLRITCS